MQRRGRGLDRRLHHGSGQTDPQVRRRAPDVRRGEDRARRDLRRRSRRGHQQGQGQSLQDHRGKHFCLPSRHDHRPGQVAHNPQDGTPHGVRRRKAAHVRHVEMENRREGTQRLRVGIRLQQESRTSETWSRLHRLHPKCGRKRTP